MKKVVGRFLTSAERSIARHGQRAKPSSTRPRLRINKAVRLKQGDMKGCSILAKLLEMDGSGPTPPWPKEDFVAISWGAASCF